MSAAQADVFAALVDVDARTIWLPPTGMSGSFDWNLLNSHDGKPMRRMPGEFHEQSADQRPERVVMP